MLSFSTLSVFSFELLTDKSKLIKYLNQQRILRGLDQVHIIDRDKNVLYSSSNSGYLAVEDKAIKMVMNDDRPLKIINAFENKSAAIISIPRYDNAFLYVVKFLDKDISKYLRESEEALNFYYTVDDKNLGIKISFALIYIIIVAVVVILAFIFKIDINIFYFSPV